MDEAAMRMWADDAASAMLGMEVVDVSPGRGRVSMVVRPDMVNGHGLCHGGVIASLADSAFALACNSHGPVTVAAGFAIDSWRRAAWARRSTPTLARSRCAGGRGSTTSRCVPTTPTSARSSRSSAAGVGPCPIART